MIKLYNTYNNLINIDHKCEKLDYQKPVQLTRDSSGPQFLLFLGSYGHWRTEIHITLVTMLLSQTLNIFPLLLLLQMDCCGEHSGPRLQTFITQSPHTQDKKTCNKGF